MSDFSRNLNALVRADDARNQFELAGRIGLDRSVLSRLCHGHRKPTMQQLKLIARYFRVNQDSLLVSHEEFKEKLSEIRTGGDLPLAGLRIIAKSRSQPATDARRVLGQFAMYYGRTEDDEAICSFLAIEDRKGQGLGFTLVNPFRDAAGVLSFYEYSGMVFPISSFLYLIGEQANDNEYEILTLIIQVPKSPEVTTSRGLIAGIGVRDNASQISGDNFLLVRRRRPVDDWATLKGSEIGYVPYDKLPEAIRRNIVVQRIRIAP